MIDSIEKIKVIPRMASQFVKDENVAVVSFYESGYKHQPQYSPSIKDIIRFDVADLDGSKQNHIEISKIKNLKIFDENDAKELVNFINKVKSKVDVLYFQCEAGISRSAGAVAAVSKSLFGNDDKFFKEYKPNMWIYNLILKEFHK